jgi:two-component SAPR family response regulator
VEALHRYLSALPGEVLKRKPELMLQLGNARWRLGQPGVAIAAFEDARAAFASQNDLSGVCRALTRLAEVNRAQGNYRHAEQLATEALSFAPATDHAARADALMAQAKSAGFLKGMDEGRLLAEQAVEEARLAEGGLSPLARAAFLQSLGQICWWHGDPQATVHYCQEALQLAPEEISPTAAQACVSLTSPYLYWHQLDKALNFAERGLEIAQTLHLKELLPSAYTALGNVLTRLGETARAEACLRQALEMGQQSGLASYEQLMATGYLAYNLCGQGRSEEARQLAESALWSYTGSGEPYEAFVCRSVLADVALDSGGLDKAEALYTELVEVGERRQFRIPLAMVYFGLAYVHLETQRAASGLDYARKALQLIQSSGAFQLFLDQGNRGRVVSEALIQAGERSPFLERVLENLPERQGFETIAGQHSIVVQCLGSFRVWVNGEEVSQERWVSAKARDLLAYLVTTRGERIHVDRIFEAIWGDKALMRRAAFHTALSRLRSALRHGDGSPRVVLVEVGEYWLDAARFKIDVDEFDAALANARAARSAAVAAQWYEQAVALYQGDYLPNLYYEWVFAERRRLAQAYINALRTLTDYYSDHQQYRRALELNRCALNGDPLQEDLHCQALRLHAALGSRAGLMQQYQELKRVLSAELEVKPLASTQALYQQLLEGLEGQGDAPPDAL